MTDYLRFQVARDARTVRPNHNVHHASVWWGWRCGAHVPPLVVAIASILRWYVRLPLSLAATSAKIIEVPKDRKCNTERKDSTSDAEGAAVQRPIVAAEDLSAVDAGDVGAHDDPTLMSEGCSSNPLDRTKFSLQGHRKGSLLGIIARERHPGYVERVREGSEDLCPNYAEVADIPTAELGEDAVEDIAKQVHAKPRNHGLAAT